MGYDSITSTGVTNYINMYAGLSGCISSEHGKEAKVEPEKCLAESKTTAPAPPMPSETKNHVYSEQGKIWAALYNKGARGRVALVMPDITDVSISNNQRVIFVTFADGTKEKAVLSEFDMYSLEQGISICIAKKLLSMKTDNNGSSIYNKLIDRALKVINRKVEEEYENEQEKIKEKKKLDKIKEKKVKRAAAIREAQIEAQKEAYLRAMREMQTNVG